VPVPPVFLDMRCMTSAQHRNTGITRSYLRRIVEYAPAAFGHAQLATTICADDMGPEKRQLVERMW
jgi:hypothetical protein